MGLPDAVELGALLPLPPSFFSEPALPEVTAEDLMRVASDGEACAGWPLACGTLPVCVAGAGIVLVSGLEWQRYVETLRGNGEDTNAGAVGGLMPHPAPFSFLR